MYKQSNNANTKEKEKQMKNVIATIALVAATATSVSAADFFAGSTPQAGYDRVRTSTGAECQTSLDTGKYMNIGTYAVNEDSNSVTNNDVGVYANLTVMLGRDKIKRVNCNKLYDLQAQRDSVEIQRLQEEIALMKAQTEAMLAAGKEATVTPAGDDW
jgi:hypothetical protein